MRRCKVCGAAARHLRSVPNQHPGPARLDVDLCRECGLLFVSTQVSRSDLERAYDELPGEYYETIATESAAKAAGAADEIAALLGAVDGAVLDVGCGHGHLLEALAERLPRRSVEGLELPGVAAAASAAKGFVVRTSIEDVDGPYAMVVLLDVAEHLADPCRTLSACARLLGPGGRVYGHTPRRTVWDSLFLFLSRVPGLQRIAWLWLASRVSVFHLQLWTDRSLRIALENAGLTPVSVRPVLELSWSLDRYAEVYLRQKGGFPRPVVAVARAVAALLFVRLGLLRNKAIFVATTGSGA